MILTEQEKYKITYLARKALESEFQEKPISLEIKEKSLMQRRGAFVFLENTEGEIRGASGYLMPEMPLWKTIVHSTKLAMRDQRYPPIQQQEAQEIRISITLITEVKPLTKELQENKGILAIYGPLQGITFPQEIKKRGWTMKEALFQTLKKAKIPEGARKSEECKIYEITCETVQENKTYLKHLL